MDKNRAERKEWIVTGGGHKAGTGAFNMEAGAMLLVSTAWLDTVNFLSTSMGENKQTKTRKQPKDASVPSKQVVSLASISTGLERYLQTQRVLPCFVYWPSPERLESDPSLSLLLLDGLLLPALEDER